MQLNLFIVIIQLMGSVMVWPKVIPLSGIHCSRDKQREQSNLKEEEDSDTSSFMLESGPRLAVIQIKLDGYFRNLSCLFSNPIVNSVLIR